MKKVYWFYVTVTLILIALTSFVLIRMETSNGQKLSNPISKELGCQEGYVFDVTDGNCKKK